MYFFYSENPLEICVSTVWSPYPHLQPEASVLMPHHAAFVQFPIILTEYLLSARYCLIWIYRNPTSHGKTLLLNNSTTFNEVKVWVTSEFIRSEVVIFSVKLKKPHEEVQDFFQAKITNHKCNEISRSEAAFRFYSD